MPSRSPKDKESKKAGATGSRVVEAISGYGKVRIYSRREAKGKRPEQTPKPAARRWLCIGGNSGASSSSLGRGKNFKTVGNRYLRDWFFVPLRLPRRPSHSRLEENVAMLPPFLCPHNPMLSLQKEKRIKIIGKSAKRREKSACLLGA